MKQQGFPLTATYKCSFGIYLLHVLVLYTIYRVFRFNLYLHGEFIAMLLIAAVTLVLSCAIARVLKCIPGIRKIV
jgi:peptidoglycan/LPS O-acetylase OafA/YrhL